MSKLDRWADGMVYRWIIVSKKKKKKPHQTILVVNLTDLNFNDILTIVLLDSIQQSF